MDTPRKVSVGGLESEQVEALEDELGMPLTEWGIKGSIVRTMRRVLEVGNGVEAGAYKKVTAKAMAELVALDDDPND